MDRIESILDKLSQSKFRDSFHLNRADLDYIEKKGMETIKSHAEDFITKRLAPAYIPNDGKQTPMKGHPVFKAQHATATCCRGCLSKWHKISKGRCLTEEEKDYILKVIIAWIKKEKD